MSFADRRKRTFVRCATQASAVLCLLCHIFSAFVGCAKQAFAGIRRRAFCRYVMSAVSRVCCCCQVARHVRDMPLVPLKELHSIRFACRIGSTCLLLHAHVICIRLGEQQWVLCMGRLHAIRKCVVLALRPLLGCVCLQRMRGPCVWHHTGCGCLSTGRAALRNACIHLHVYTPAACLVCQCLAAYCNIVLDALFHALVSFAEPACYCF